MGEVPKQFEETAQIDKKSKRYNKTGQVKALRKGRKVSKSEK